MLPRSPHHPRIGTTQRRTRALGSWALAVGLALTACWATAAGIATGAAPAIPPGAPGAAPITTGAATPIPPQGNPCVPAPPGTSPFTADANRLGFVDLYFINAQGAPVTFYECVGGNPRYLGVQSQVVNGSFTPFYSAAEWRCDRTARYFAATATLPDGSFVRGTTDLQTPSCANRFAIETPSRLVPRQLTTVELLDRWDLGGVPTRLCYEPPIGAPDCHTVTFPSQIVVAQRKFRPRERGEWKVALQVGGYWIHESVAVGVKALAAQKPLPTVLATGDSTMGGVDNFLADDLGQAATVYTDVHPGASISQGDTWAAIASAQVTRLHPAVTVVSLGANEGFPMTTADGTVHGCCDAAWVAQYTADVRQIMLIYRQRHARVTYLTIPTPLDPARAVVTNAVNGAIVQAAAGLIGVQVLRMDQLFSPNGYQNTISIDGHAVDVRAPDGVHLNIAGTAIEAEQVAAALHGI